MRILHISPYSPVPPNFGGALRVYHMLKGLARHHEVTFVTIGQREDEELLNLGFGEDVKHIHVVPQRRNPVISPRWNLVARALLSGKSLLFQNASATDTQAVLDRLCRTEKYDVALAEFPTMAQFHLPGHIIKILDEHNVEYSNLKRMYKGTRFSFRKGLYYREHRKLLHEEIDVCHKMDAIFTTSVNDEQVLDREIPLKDKYVIPNGVETNYFTPSDEETEPYSMVYTGTMDYFPNQDAMLYFLDSIFPEIIRLVPQAKLYVVGKNPPSSLRRRASNNVIITGCVPDVRPYTRKASVYVVPLRMGSGTRLKILEGLAMKKAIVTTTIGCEGIDVTDGINVDVADQPHIFARKVADLFLNRERAKSLGEKGYELVKKRYDWEVVSDMVESAIQSIVRRHRGPILAQTDRQLSAAEKKRPRNGVIQPNRKSSVKVMMYHRIVEDTEHMRGYFWTITKSQLRQELEMLDKWGYTCIGFQDYSLFQKGELVLPKKPVILTFDDGYEEIHKNALPILREFGVKATMFVLGDQKVRANLWDTDPDINGVPLLDGRRIRELYQAGFEIGSHSMTHPSLTKLPGKEAWMEISDSKKNLEDLIQASVTTFAYPFGLATQALKEMVRSAGYDYGCGVFSGPPRFADDVYNIRRIPMTRTTNVLDFAFKVLAPYEYYAWARWKAHHGTIASLSP